MGSSSDSRTSNSSEKNFGIGENQFSSHEEALDRVESLFREAGGIIRDIPPTYLGEVWVRVQTIFSSVNMEEKWEGDEASHCVERLQCNNTSSQPSARAKRSAYRLKRPKTEFVKFLGENPRNFSVQEGVIILDSDVDESGNPPRNFVEEGDVVFDETETTFRVDVETVVGDIGGVMVAYAGPIVEADAGKETDVVAAETASRWDVEASMRDVEAATADAAFRWNLCCPKDCWEKCLKGDLTEELGTRVSAFDD